MALNLQIQEIFLNKLFLKAIQVLKKETGSTLGYFLSSLCPEVILEKISPLEVDDVLLALDAATGRPRWQASAGSLIESVTSTSITILATTRDGEVVAFEPQGEGVTWGADGESLYLASEGRNGRPPQLSRILCRSD